MDVAPLNAAQIGGALLPFAALVLAALGFVLAPEHVSEGGRVLFLASVLALGLPHGAVDHLVIARFERASLTSRAVIVRLAAYVAAVLLTLAAWWLLPVAVFGGFILLTLFHWGQGDNWFQHRLYGARTGWDGILLAGGLPMLVPLVAFPGVYTEVAEAFVAATGRIVELDGFIALLQWPAVIFLVAVALVRIVRERHARAAVAAETGALAVFFGLVPPVAAIAVYFCFWHAPRHLVRLSELLYGADDARGDWSAAWRTLIATVPLTLVSIAGLAGLYYLVVSDDIFSVYLALIAALTVPHVVVVTWMDRRQLS